MDDDESGNARSDLNKCGLYEQLVESVTGFAILTMDPDGIVTSWNTGAERLIGYRDAEIVGLTADLIFVPEDRACGAAAAERAKALAEGRAEDERWHVRKDGSRFWGSGLLMPLTDRRSGFVKIMRDLSDRHLAEKRLRDSEAIFRLLATNIPQLVFQSRGTGERTWGSPQWIAFTGLGLEESLDFGWLNAVHPDDREATVEAWHAAQEVGEYYIEHRIRRATDGEFRWHQTRARSIGSDEETAGSWVGTSTDVHDMRSLQDRQVVLLAELQHRTRNLLAVVQSIARQTLRASPSLETFETQFAERLSALGRVQSLLARANHQPINLRELVHAELAAHGDGRSEMGKVTIEGPPAAVSAGAAQALSLAIHELATNAVKYGALSRDSGRLTVTWQIERAETRAIVLDWRESGVAIQAGEPKRRGYGSELIERAIPYQLKARTRLEFGTHGVHCQIAVPVTEGVNDDSAAK
jgi:PAS domain S-box-containing protein